MEPTFQTTFIPKRPVAPVSNKTKPSGLIIFVRFLSTLIFIASIAAYGILYFYRGQLSGSIETTSQGLERQSQTFDANIIGELNDINRRLRSAEKLLESHTVISPVFKSLEEITLKSVTYKNFNLQISQETKNIAVKIAGTAKGYDIIAIQSDMFSKNRFFQDPVFSNLTPDGKGNIDFSLTFLVDPTFVLYKTYANQ